MARLALAALLLALSVAGCGIAGSAKIEAPVTVYVSLPLTGPRGGRRPRRRRRRAAGAGAGAGQGRLDPGPGGLPRRRQGQGLGPGRRRGQCPPGGPGLIRRRVHRRARLGADAGLGADHQRRRPGAGLTRRGRGGPDAARRRAIRTPRPLPTFGLAQLRPDRAGGRRGRRRGGQLGVGARCHAGGGDLGWLRFPEPGRVRIQVRGHRARDPGHAREAALGGRRGREHRQAGGLRTGDSAADPLRKRARQLLGQRRARSRSRSRTRASPRGSRSASTALPGSYAAYGYEAMGLVLQAIRGAGTDASSFRDNVRNGVFGAHLGTARCSAATRSRRTATRPSA